MYISDIHYIMLTITICVYQIFLLSLYFIIIIIKVQWIY